MVFIQYSSEMDIHASESVDHSLRGIPIKTKLLEKATRFFARQPAGRLATEAVALVAVIGVIDYLTGYEVTIFPFYSIPILLMVWFGSGRAAILIAIMSTLAWWWADAAAGHHYSQEWLRTWDAMVRFIFFLLVIISGSAVHERIKLLEHSQKLEREIISISEREQQRIGRDLHDGLGQYLVAIGMAADSLRDDLAKQAHPDNQAAGRIADLLHDAVSRVRDLSRGLSPVDRDEGGLKAALKELASSVSKLSGIPCSVIYEGNIPIRDNTTAVHLYRIAQEALNNAIKHGRPSLVVIAFEISRGFLSLRVSDNGIGMDSALSKNHGMGFNIMRYRARMLGGSLEVLPNSPTGTIVVCSVRKGTEGLLNPESGV